VWESRRLNNLDPQIKTLLIHLYHAKSGHWAIACCNIHDRTVDQYDSFSSSESSPSSQSRLEACATRILDPASQAWGFQAPTPSRQTNIVDCGVFAVLAAIYVMAGYLGFGNLVLPSAGTSRGRADATIASSSTRCFVLASKPCFDAARSPYQRGSGITGTVSILIVLWRRTPLDVDR
jgi:hypothetical protein